MSSSDVLVPPPFGSGVAFVTGAGGFLGGAVVSAFQRAGWRTAGFGHPRRHPDDAEGLTPPKIRLEGDVLRRQLSQAAEVAGSPEVVFHAAGGASVGASIADPEADFRRTVLSLRETLAFLEADAPGARLIYPSSAAVYGALAASPIPETAQPNPISPYGRHKLQVETEIDEARNSFALDAVVVRFFSLYGPGLRKQLLWDLAQRLTAADRVELGGQGDERRDFLFIEDAVRLVGVLAEAEAPPKLINGASGQAASVREVAQGLARALGRPAEISFSGVVREGDPRALVADAARLSALGFVPGVSLHEGLQRTAAWMAKARAAAPA